MPDYVMLRSNKNYNRRRIKIRYRILIYFAVIILFAAGLMLYSEIRMRPIITSMAEAHARSIASKVVSEAISEEIEANNISYDDLISFEKDESGKIAALKTDIIMVNRLKSRLSVVILNKIANMDDINLYIPIGNLLNGEFFSGRGPRLEIIVIPVGSVTTNITNVFTSAGINQTRHQIMLEVYVTVSVILPFSMESTDISTSIAIAETVRSC
jgi:sporulation protein YunB